jgi:hypothetical protein
MDLKDYYVDFQQDVATDASVTGDYTVDAFIRRCGEILGEADQFEEIQVLQFEGTGQRKRKLRVQGYDLSASDDTASLIVGIHHGTPEISTVTTMDAKNALKALQYFLDEATSGQFEVDREASSPVVQAAIDIRLRRTSISRFRLHLVTDGKLSDRLRDLPSEELNGVPIDFSFWDIERFHQLHESKQQREALQIDVTEWAPTGIPALEIAGTEDFATYLAAVPGSLLSDLYSRHGNRLLESNVRSYLSNRGKVNKGIRDTVNASPHLFMAYNNGITATATKVEMSADRSSILSVVDLQIVNGGQTTASLFYVGREQKTKGGLADVVVPMKLVMVDEDLAQSLVPNISRFANSQNAVSAADFFSNSPFHQRIEDLSRRIRVPAVAGNRIQSKWYYERIRGQYSNEKTRRVTSEALRFEQENPKSQMFTKTDLAKYLTSWDQKPHIVSAGAQKNFLNFAVTVTKKWDSSPDDFNDEFFRDSVAKNILFNSVRREVSKADWYKDESGYLANIVTYTIAKLANILEAKAGSRVLDFSKIWNQQAVSPNLLAYCVELAYDVRRVLTSEHRLVQNVTEWAKREDCWTQVRGIPAWLPDEATTWLADPMTVIRRQNVAKSNQKIDSGIQAQTRVIETSSDRWLELEAFLSTVRVATPKETSILGICTGRRPGIPTEAQSKVLVQLVTRANTAGFEGFTI